MVPAVNGCGRLFNSSHSSGFTIFVPGLDCDSHVRGLPGLDHFLLKVRFHAHWWEGQPLAERQTWISKRGKSRLSSAD